ncbi:MAG: isopentenyl-diphosphate Delta-isomerase [Pseudomonadota bacterium]|nr:isopentenyl-diphosphate Delta-isomerase [Gammaproteobacteria bacterium]
MEQVVLVDVHDHEIGVEEKIKAHREALCHRAFSVFIFKDFLPRHSRFAVNPDFELLLQQRQFGKYHSEGKWTNTCCGHPRPNETVERGAHRRLKEEMGLDIPLKEIGVFHYQANCAEGIFENEVDHVFVGFYHDEPIQVDKEEVAAYRWIDVSQLLLELKSQSLVYTPWFKEAFLLALQNLKRENT